MLPAIREGIGGDVHNGHDLGLRQVNLKPGGLPNGMTHGRWFFG